MFDREKDDGDKAGFNDSLDTWVEVERGNIPTTWIFGGGAEVSKDGLSRFEGRAECAMYARFLCCVTSDIIVDIAKSFKKRLLLWLAGDRRCTWVAHHIGIKSQCRNGLSAVDGVA